MEQKGDTDRMLHEYRRSLQLLAQLAGSEPSNLTVQDELARAYETLADGLGRTANATEEILTNYRKSLAIREELLRQDSSSAKSKRAVAINLMKIGGALDPHQPEAIAALHKGVATLESLAAIDPNNGRARREVGWGYKQLGTTQVAANDYSHAVESLQKSLAIKESSAAADPQNAQASLDLASGHVDLAEALSALGVAPRAVEQARKGITIMTALSAVDPTNAIYSRNLAVYEEKLGDAFARSGADAQAPTAQRTHDWSEARVAYEKAGKIFADLRDLGTLPPADAGQPQKFTALTADCQRAIEQLTGANPN
jgi:tetratricopeptide (TPR) repeat protein